MTDVDPAAFGVEDLPWLLHRARWGFDFDGIVHRLQNDELFAAQMRLCHEWHMPHSELLKWSDEDQAKALAYQAHEARRCQRCGIHPDSDWPDPQEPMFDAVLEVCPGCAETDRYQRHVTEQQEKMPKSASDGVRIVLKRRD